MCICVLQAQVREEQRQKAAEAEERKKRRQEQQAKKAAARQKAAEEAAAAAVKAAKAANRAAALAAAVAADAENVASGTDGERDEPLSSQEAGEDAVVATTSHSKGGKGSKARKGKQHHLPAPPVAKPLKKAAKPQKWHQQYVAELTCAVVALLVLILAYLSITSR